MRQGELLGLRWDDIDLDARQLRVRRQLGRDGKYAEPKTDRGKRTIAFPPSTARALERQKRQQEEQRKLWGRDYKNAGLVFSTHQGRPLGCRNVVREFKQLLTRSGLPDMPFHGLRHTAVLLMILNNVPIKVIQERLGHSSISITLDTYGHLLPSMDRDAADGLEEFLT